MKQVMNYNKNKGLLYDQENRPHDHMIMEIIHIAKDSKRIVLMSLSALLLSICTSCVHNNSWIFKVENQTEDTLIITTETIMPDFNVQVENFNYSDSDPYCRYYVNVSDTIFMLPPYTNFNAFNSWSTRDVLSDTPEADGVTPGWKFIKQLILGGQPLAPDTWNSKQKWRIAWEYDEIEREYTLTITQ